MRSSTSCLVWALARLAYRKCCPRDWAAPCNSGTRKALIYWTIFGRTPRSGTSVAARCKAAVSWLNDIFILASLFVSNKPVSRHDPAEARIVIGGVITSVRRFGSPSAHNAPDSPGVQIWCCDGIFTVVAALLEWQKTLTVAKHHTIFFMRKRTALMNQVVGLHALLG